MKNYIGAKIIKAEPMDHHTFLNKIKNQDVPSGSENQEGYHVQYSDTYHSWSPKDIFETAYRVLNNDEVELLKTSS